MRIFSVREFFSKLNSRQDVAPSIIWSRRSIELRPLAGYYDTLAHLLYRYGFYAEAEFDQNMAVELALKENLPQATERFKAEALKMKKKLL